MKKFKGLKITGIVIATIAVFFLIINVIPPKKVVTDNPFIPKTNTPMLVAHRGGGENNPENTLKAFHNSVADYQTQIIETDLWFTKDDKLVYNHDGKVDRVSDSKEILKKDNVAIRDLTLDELRNLNFGYNFKDEQGNYPYRDLPGLNNPLTRKKVLKDNMIGILEMSELFEHFYTSNPDIKFIVEIKNPGELGAKAAQMIDDCLTNDFPEFKDNIVIGTFHPEVEKCLRENHPTLMRGASTAGATGFILTQLFGVNLFNNNASFVCLQLPTTITEHGITLKLARKTYIKRAHRRNIAVQFWTINEAEEMKSLIELGADAIMTDNPKLLREILNTFASSRSL